MCVCVCIRDREHKRVFTAFSLKIFSNGCMTSKIVRRHDVRERVCRDWKQIFMCRRVKIFEMGVVGGR